MSATAEEAREALGRCHEELCTAIVGVDQATALGLCERLIGLLALLGAEGAEVAVFVALDLIDLWLDADSQEWGESATAAAELAIDVLVRLGDVYPDPVFAGAYEQSACKVLEIDPALAADRLRRAVTLAETDDERARYLVTLVLAVQGAGDPDDALQIAREAGRLAGDPETLDDAATFEIELLCDLDSEQAGAAALAALARHGYAASNGLGAAMMRALIGEAARAEAKEEPVSAPVAEGLRAGLGRPGWVPEPLTASDFATAVAWIDFSRDDLSRLEATMAGAPGPFSDRDIEAQAALLRFMVAMTRMDPAQMERALRAAAPLVAASGAAGIVTTFRACSQLLAQARNGATLANPASEFEALQSSQGRTVAEEQELFEQCFEAVREVRTGRARSFPLGLRARLDEWCSRPDHGSADPMSVAIIWAMGVASAMFDGHRGLADGRLRHLAEVQRHFEPGSAQARWLDMVLDGLRPALGSAGDPDAGARAAREAGLRHRRSGNELGAFVADCQLAVLQVARAPREALAAVVRALDFRRRHLASLPGSSERLALRDYEQDLTACALRAAGALGEPRLMAELLEFLRAQEMPEVLSRPDAVDLPLSMLLPPPAFDGDSRATLGADLTDAVMLPEARAVRMPWGSIALAEFVSWDDGAGHPPVELGVPVVSGQGSVVQD